MRDIASIGVPVATRGRCGACPAEPAHRHPSCMPSIRSVLPHFCVQASFPLPVVGGAVIDSLNDGPLRFSDPVLQSIHGTEPLESLHPRRHQPFCERGVNRRPLSRFPIVGDNIGVPVVFGGTS